jgi:hypothetical protein
MSEGDWSSEGAALAQPKRRVPLWVWGCGGGCALFLLVMVVLGFFGFRFVRKAMDQDLNWAAIEEVLPVVERPANYMVVGFPMRFDGVRMWFLESADNSHQVVLMHAEPGEDAEATRGELFHSGAPGTQRGVLAVQGRTLAVLRFDSQGATGGKGGPLEDLMMRFAEGAMANVDLTSPDSADLLILMYNERGSGAQVDDDELIEFLSHFRIPAAQPSPETSVEPATDAPPDGGDDD